MRDYYLGLDMGTDSVGWAVTDMSYKLIKFKQRDMWGIREFERANTSVDRRTKRISRRRRQRQQVREGIIKDYFHDAISEVDKDFYLRLENSKYHIEDKDENVRYKNGIFNDPDYSDADYYKQYPTIFHLRKELIDNKEEHDVRLVFLAVYNLFKRRGHFLNEGLNINATTDISEAYIRANNALQEYYEDIEFPCEITVDELINVLCNKDISRTRKSELLCDLFGIDKKKEKVKVNLVKLICGLSCKLKDIFVDVELEDEKLSIQFSDSSYSEKELEIAPKLGDAMQILETLKSFYDCHTLLSILGGNKESYLSYARVEQYNKHKADLKMLKDIIKKYGGQEKYDEIFRSDNDGTYSAYVNSVNSTLHVNSGTLGRIKKRRSFKSRKRDEFYKNIKTYLDSLVKKGINDERIVYVLNEISKESFLPKQLTSDNGVIPNQVHGKELKKILENASGYLPFLSEIDESGLTTKERIVRLFEFTIPYYIGPVSEESEKNGGNGWVIRKESGRVYPWNLEEKIDVDKTSERFIERLIRRCTYLSDEKVMPKHSLKYEKYCVLNEINNLRIKGQRIDASLKKEIYNDLFMCGKKVNKNTLVEYLYTRGLIDDKSEVTGVDTNIANYLGSLGKFESIFGDKIREDKYKNTAEDIIRISTIYGDSKKKLKKVLLKSYGDILSEDQIKRIIGFKFKDWGRLSKEFLDLQGCNTETGEICTIIEALMEDNLNLMELINSEKYDFKKVLESKQKSSLKTLSEFKAADLDDYYFSAPVKRMIWQTILIIKEIEGIMKCPPKKIFIEMTRTDEEKGDKGRKKSRESELLDLFKNIKEDGKYWTELIKKENESGRLRSKKMYLYITQMGKCMYTGRQIELDDLFDDNKYDIDHIYPRSFVKDDNLKNNLVLVEKGTNARKSDTYPIDGKIRNNNDVRNHWKMLNEKKLISDEKYRRLTASEGFSDEQLSNFIARQLVETGQATKGIADLLKELLKDTELVYSKARNVSDFRRNGLSKKNENDDVFLFPKSRLVNDFHHAHDAYLNIVVGNAYNVRFTKNPAWFIKNEYNKDRNKNRYTLNNILSKDIERNGEIGWLAYERDGMEKSIDIVSRMLAKNTPILTRMNFTATGAISEETLVGHYVANQKNYIPLKNDSKMNDVTKYGGFTSVKIAYFFLVEHDDKKKKIRTIEAMPIYLTGKIKNEKESLEEYCREYLHLVNPNVRVKKIKIQSLISLNGYRLHISSKTGNQVVLRNAVSMCLNRDWIGYIKLIENYLEKQSNNVEYFSKEKNEKLYCILKEKSGTQAFINRPNCMNKLINDGYEKFIELDVNKQVKVLCEILKTTAIGLGSANLTDIGGNPNSGTMKISKTIPKTGNMLIINQSVTGLYEKTIDLQKV